MASFNNSEKKTSRNLTKEFIKHFEGVSANLQIELYGVPTDSISPIERTYLVHFERWLRVNGCLKEDI